MLELMENAQASIDELMNDAARALVEQLLALSAQEVACTKLRGRAGDDVLWHGTQRGQVALAERKLQITRPRLRSKAASKEVAVPAYERLSGDDRMGVRVRDILAPGAPPIRAHLQSPCGLLAMYPDRMKPAPLALEPLSVG